MLSYPNALEYGLCVLFIKRKVFGLSKSLLLSEKPLVWVFPMCRLLFFPKLPVKFSMCAHNMYCAKNIAWLLATTGLSMEIYFLSEVRARIKVAHNVIWLPSRNKKVCKGK